jgi:hydrogenase-4 component F
LLTTMPWTGGLFAAGMLAVIGLPPFGLFISEFALFRAGFAAGHPWLMGLVLALLAVAFVSMIGHLNRMLYGAPPVGTAVGEGSAWPLVPLGLCVAALVVLGLTVPAPLDTLLQQIVEIAGR